MSSHVPTSGTAESRADPASTYAASGRRLRRAATAVCVVLGATVVAFALAVQTYSPFRHPVLFVAGGLAVMTGVSALSVFVATARHMIHTPLPVSSRTTPPQQRPRIGTVRDIPLFMSSLVSVFTVFLFVVFGARGLPRYVMGGSTARADVMLSDTHVSCYKRCVNVIESTYVTRSGQVRTRVVGNPQLGTTVIYSLRNPRQAMTVAAYDAAPGNVAFALVNAAIAILAALGYVLFRRRRTGLGDTAHSQVIPDGLLLDGRLMSGRARSRKPGSRSWRRRQS